MIWHAGCFAAVRPMTSVLPQRAFGSTGLSVSVLGFGAGQIGTDQLTDREVDRLLHDVLDCGVNLIDTARSYGRSEERLGRFLRGRQRDSVVLSTKVGYGIDGVEDWTGACVTAGIEEALRRLATDCIDIVHLHSCPRDVLQRGDVVQALIDAKLAGKLRVAAYSGDNEDLRFAIDLGAFDAIQTSLNVCDQRAADYHVPMAVERGMGVIAKRPVANAPWRFAERPAGNECEFYWDRWHELRIDPAPFDWQELALRFAVWFPGVHSAIVGTSRAEHLRENVEIAARGPLPGTHTDAIRYAFDTRGLFWEGRI